MNKQSNQAGFGHVMVIVAIVVVAAIGFAGYRVMNSKDKTDTKQSTSTAAADKVQEPVWPMDEGLTWQATGEGSWLTTPYDKKVPACPSPLVLNSPTPDLSKATSILYPGQSRVGKFEGKGGNYKPHGGIRFDNNADNNVTVVMPFDGYVMRGSQFLVDGEIQYSFDIVNPCGIMIRLGHLRELTPAFQAIADKFPAATEGDSRTTKVEPMLPFKTGDKIATAVGFKTTKNVGFDYGVYDLTKDNEASKDAAYKAAHSDTAELSYHAVCWLNIMGTKDTAIVKALPGGDTAAGKTSDYCK